MKRLIPEHVNLRADERVKPTREGLGLTSWWRGVVESNKRAEEQLEADDWAAAAPLVPDGHRAGLAAAPGLSA